MRAPLLAVFGTISVGYLPNGKIIGLSKLARCVEVFARRLQVQERLTAELCREVERELGADGVLVVSVTTHAEGRFATDAGLRAEFLQAITNR